jgi:UDP-N-acetylmuramyl pentapeptide phosphotransferase/UDP-N-acetylglucosamine-1-phosphate transferase
MSRRRVPALVLAAMLAVPALAQESVRSRGFYANVVITTQDDLRLEFLNEAAASVDECKAAADLIANTVRASCTTCGVVKLQCPSKLEPRQERLLSEEPVDIPSSRLPRGVVAYLSANPQLALASCRETELRASTGQGYTATCYPPQSMRPLYSALAPESPSRLRIGALGVLVLMLTALASGFAGFLIVRYERVHGHWSADPVNVGPQKFHATPTPRIGGLGVIAGLLLASGTLRVAEPGRASELFGYLLFASLPAFLGGITEDATKSTSVPVRLALTMVAAAVGVWLLGAIIPRLDVPGFDTLLRWTPFAIAFTIFAVGGVANSINIIDGYNGLAAGHAVIVLAAFAWISSLVGDEFLFLSALAMSGALIGFLVWNYPGGKIFLGDGGAYLLGFWLGELSVLLVVRHPEVSPWFPLLLLVFPIYETIFSMYRRRVVLGLSPGQPDRLHMHQVIYASLPRTAGDAPEAEQVTKQNSRVAPYFWLMSVGCAVPALLLWGNSTWLITISLLFCVGYTLLYRALSKQSQPS